MKKKIFTLLLAIAAGIGSMFASKEVNGIWYNFNSSTKTASVTYRGSSYDSYSKEYSGDVVIPESVTYNGITYSVTSIGNEAFYGCSDLTFVTIPNSVTSIGNRAFYNCTSLNFVTIPNSVTSIGDWAFNGCSGLTFVTIPNSVTSIGNRAFYNCTSLNSVTIPNSVTSIGQYAFEDCSGLTSVVWNAKNCSNSSISNGLFYSSRAHITSFTFGNEVEHIPAYLCYGMSNLTSIEIPNSVTSIGNDAFRGCRGLTSVTIPNSVTYVGGKAFIGCRNLTSIVWNAKNCGDFNDSFFNMGYTPFYSYDDDNLPSQIASFTFGNEVEHIPAYLCYGMSNLIFIEIPNSVTSIGSSAFSSCSGLTKVNIMDIAAWCNIAFRGSSSNPLYYAKHLYVNDVEVTDLVIPNSVTSIGDYAFYNCSGFTSVTIPNSVASIGDYAFSGCSGLTKVNIMDIAAWCNIAFRNSESNPLYYAKHLYVNDVEVTDLVIPNSVTSIGHYAFSGCSGLTTVTIGNNVTSIGGSAFSGCSGLTTVTIGNNVTSIGGSAFYYCSGLTSVTIGNGVTSIGNSAFYGCSGLTSVTIGNGVTSIGGRAFSGCTSLNSIVWNAKNCPDFAPNNTPFYGTDYIDSYYHIYFDLRPQITSFTFGSDVEHIPANLLEGMSNLPFINLSNTIAWAEQNFSKTNSPLNSMTLYLNGQEIKKLTISDGVTSIGAYTFINCAKMTELTIPSSVTTIGEGAFMNENRLQKITLGENIETIADSAFANCPYLLEIHARMEFPPVIDASVFADCGDLSGIDCYVPEDSYAFYKKTAVWKEFNLIAEQEPEPTAINPVSDDKPAQMNKILRNGQIFILRGDKTYSITGQEVK